jgi:hypothetical protein
MEKVHHTTMKVEKTHKGSSLLRVARDDKKLQKVTKINEYYT